MLVVTILAVGAAIWLIWKLFLKPWLKYSYYLSGKIPAPAYIFPPPIGHTFILEKDAAKLMDQIQVWSKVYPGCFMFWLGPKPFILVNAPEYIEKVLRSSDYNRKGGLYDFIHPWLGTGLLTSWGNKWKGRRRLLTPAFHFTILRSFYSVMAKQSQIFVSVLKKKAKTEKSINIAPLIALCALDIICETAMGISPGAQQDGDSEYVNAVKLSNSILFKRLASAYLWPDWLFWNLPIGKKLRESLKILKEFTAEAIQQRTTYLTESGLLESRKDLMRIKSTSDNNHNDAKNESVDEGNIKEITNLKEAKLPFLDLLIAAADLAEKEKQGQPLSQEDIQEEVDTFMFEGHDTTSAAMSWTMFFLGSNPDIQKKARDEIDAVWKDKEMLEFDDVSKLEYLDKVVKESLRLFPSVPLMTRQTVSEVKLGENLIIPDGVEIAFSPFALHRDEKLFPNPLKFDPERFDAEIAAERHPFAYIPFSAGSRNCIGQKFALIEEKVILASLIHHFDIKALQTESELNPCPELITRPGNGIYVELIERK